MRNTLPSIGAIIVAGKPEPALWLLVCSLLADSLVYEVLVVEVGETCPFLHRLAQSDSRLRVKHQKNVSLQAARDWAAGNVRSDFLLFVQPGKLVLPGSLELLSQRLGNADSIGSDSAGWSLRRRELNGCVGSQATDAAPDAFTDCFEGLVGKPDLYQKQLLALWHFEKCANFYRQSEFEGKTVLVTGATSQVGLCVLGRLLASGACVQALSRRPLKAYAHPALRWVEASFEQLSTAEGVRNAGISSAEILIHAAGLWQLPSVLSPLQSVGCARVIAFGSTSLFGKQSSRNPRERQIVRQLGQGELELREICNRLGIGWTLLRPTLIYGLGMDQNVASMAGVLRRLRFFPVFPPAKGLRQPVHADDLGWAALQAVLHSETAGKAYNLSGGETLGYRSMISRVAARLGKKARILELPFLPFLLDWLGRLTGRKHINGEVAHRMNEDLAFSHESAQADFQYRPRSFLAATDTGLDWIQPV